MILGLTPLVFVHVVISLLGIASGFVVMSGMFTAQRLDRWTSFFLVTTVLTSATGFILPAPGFLPSHAIGILSLIVLALAIYARYPQAMVGGWRAVYVVTALIAQYFNVFVLVVQSFLKVPALHDLAPTQGEPPFAIAQGIVLILFIVAGVFALKRFHPAAVALSHANESRAALPR